MLEPNHDYQNLFTKYEVKYSLFDKIVMGFVLTTMVICVGFLIYGVFNPIYLMC